MGSQCCDLYIERNAAKTYFSLNAINSSRKCFDGNKLGLVD